MQKTARCTRLIFALLWVLQELMGHADLKTSEIYSEKQEIWKAFFQVPDQKFSRSVKMKFSHDKNPFM